MKKLNFSARPRVKLPKPALHKTASFPTRSSRGESSFLANRGQRGSSHHPCLYKNPDRQQAPGNAHTQTHSVSAHSLLRFTERVSILGEKKSLLSGPLQTRPLLSFQWENGFCCSNRRLEEAAWDHYAPHSIEWEAVLSTAEYTVHGPNDLMMGQFGIKFLGVLS